MSVVPGGLSPPPPIPNGDAVLADGGLSDVMGTFPAVAVGVPPTVVVEADPPALLPWQNQFMEIILDEHVYRKSYIINVQNI